MANVRTGRIVRSISGFYDVQTGDKIISCRARGIFRKTGESPLTGDMVEITVEKGKGMVEKILPGATASSGLPWPISMHWWFLLPM